MVNINILLYKNNNKIMVFFIFNLIGKPVSIFPSLTLELKCPIHRGFRVERWFW